GWFRSKRRRRRSYEACDSESWCCSCVISNWFDFGQMVSEEDYRSVLEECGDLKKDVANGVKEVINLRWS
ncbi:unnamed protein product, partial [Brassica oleracea var. botrytis]